MILSAASAIQKNLLANQSDSTSAPQRIVSAIQAAAYKTGVDFSYLMKKASQESSMDPNAKASGSSATGLYQFTQQTWLQMVKNYGGEYGLGTYADKISIDSNGVAHVADPAAKQAILNLRKDPTIATEMAGELDKENQTALQDKVGGKIGGTELYLAHFLGAGGASNFLNEMHDDPQQAAADVLPAAAAANPNVFYAKDGTPKTLQQVYQHFAKKFDSSTSPTMFASATPTTSASKQTVASATHPASSMTVADTSNTSGYASAVSSNTISNPITAGTLSSTVQGIQAQGSSIFATMILSQMSPGNSAWASQNQHGKKNPYAIAAAIG